MDQQLPPANLCRSLSRACALLRPALQCFDVAERPLRAVESREPLKLVPFEVRRVSLHVPIVQLQCRTMTVPDN